MDLGQNPYWKGVVVILEFNGATEESYISLWNELGLGKGLAEDCLFHAGGPMGGGWRVVECWKSTKHFERYVASKLTPAMEAVGVERPSVKALGARSLLIAETAVEQAAPADVSSTENPGARDDV